MNLNIQLKADKKHCAISFNACIHVLQARSLGAAEEKGSA